jgi:hypothetical protein
LDRRHLWHGWHQRDRWTGGQRGDGWHHGDRRDERSHDASAWPAPHLIKAAYSHRGNEKWHKPEHDDLPHGSASHYVYPPGRREASIYTLASLEYTDGAGARQHHRWDRFECRRSPAQSLLTHPPAYIRLTMLRVCLPVLGVLGRQRLVVDAQQVFGILLLRRLGEIETPRDDNSPSMTITLLCEMAWLASISVGAPWFARKSAEEYFSVR